MHRDWRETMGGPGDTALYRRKSVRSRFVNCAKTAATDMGRTF